MARLKADFVGVSFNCVTEVIPVERRTRGFKAPIAAEGDAG